MVEDGKRDVAHKDIGGKERRQERGPEADRRSDELPLEQWQRRGCYKSINR